MTTGHAPYPPAHVSRRRPSRWLAPLAIVVIAGATYAIVDAGRAHDGGVSTATAPASKPHTTTTAPSKKQVKATYIVRNGDTLSSISLSTGVSVEQLQRLNPKLDVQALQPGQHLKLRS